MRPQLLCLKRIYGALYKGSSLIVGGKGRAEAKT